MPSVRSAILYSVASKYSVKILGLVSTMVLARLLTPTEIGTFAIASSVVMLMSEFRMLGAGIYLIRERELTPQKIKSAIGLTIIISWALGAVIALGSPVMSSFYRIPEITLLFVILSVSFFLAPYISIPSALLSREYRYKQLLILQLTSASVNFCVTVALVLLGFSFYSLAWGISIANLAEFMLMIKLRPTGTPWMPSLKDMGKVAKVGIYASVSNILRRSQTTAPDMVIGRLGSAGQVGIFSRGMGFVDFISQTIEMGISPVALPYLSNVKRQGGDMLAAYTKASTLLGSLVWPVLAVASLTTFPAIRVFFGNQWDAAAPIAAVLAYWALFRSVHSLSPPLLIASGKEALMVAKELLIFLLFIVSMIIVYPYGLEAVAWSLVGTSFTNLVLTSILLKYAIGLRLLSFYGAWIPNLVLSLVCWWTTWGIDQVIDFSVSAPIISIGYVAAILPIVWVVTAGLLKHDIYYEIRNLIAKSRKLGDNHG